MTFVYGVGRGQRLSMDAERKGGKRDVSTHQRHVSNFTRSH